MSFSNSDVHKNLRDVLLFKPQPFTPQISRSPHGGILFKDASGATKAIIKDIIKMLMKSLIGGGISLPIRIYEPRSFLERLTDTWIDLGLYLEKAAKTENSFAQALLVFKGVISGFKYAFLNQKQSFNPLLGETAYRQLPCGLCCFMEQISHHPPISRFEAYSKKKYEERIGCNDKGEHPSAHTEGSFSLFGDMALDYKLGVSSVTGRQEGTVRITLDTPSSRGSPPTDPKISKSKTFSYTLPGILIEGLDTRECFYKGALLIEGPEYDFKIYFRPDQNLIRDFLKRDLEKDPFLTESHVKAGIESVSTSCSDAQKTESAETSPSSPSKELPLEQRLDALKDFCLGAVRNKEKNIVAWLYGSWLDRIYCNDKVIWTLKERNSFLSFAQEASNTAEARDKLFGAEIEVLPCDSCMRQDLKALREGRVDEAQESKFFLEKRQRLEAKMRK